MSAAPAPDGAGLGVVVYITAPRGTGGLTPLLTALRPQLNASDRLVILDGLADGPAADPTTLPSVGEFEHSRNAGESAFHMRCALTSSGDRPISILLEDHAVPGPDFVADARRLFGAEPGIDAIRVLGRNDTSTGRWSWVNFLVTFGNCIHPAGKEPPGMISTSAVIRTRALPASPQPLGGWETRFMPGLARDLTRVAFSNEIWIDHVDPCGISEAVIGGFRNQRLVAATRIASGHRRLKLCVRAFKDIALRRPGEIGRALHGRAEYRHYAENRIRLRFVCFAAFLGAATGAFLGAGNAARKMH